MHDSISPLDGQYLLPYAHLISVISLPTGWLAQSSRASRCSALFPFHQPAPLKPCSSQGAAAITGTFAATLITILYAANHPIPIYGQPNTAVMPLPMALQPTFLLLCPAPGAYHCTRQNLTVNNRDPSIRPAASTCQWLRELLPLQRSESTRTAFIYRALVNDKGIII